MDNKFRESRDKLILSLWVNGMTFWLLQLYFTRFLQIAKLYPDNTGFYPEKTIAITYNDIVLDGSLWIELQDYYILDSDICFN